MRPSFKWAICIAGLVAGCSDDGASSDAGVFGVGPTPGVAFDAGGTLYPPTTFPDSGFPSTPGTPGTTFPPFPTNQLPDSGVTFPAPGTGTPGTPGGGMNLPVGDRMPVLPPITGDCPQFRTGTATIGGLSGISVQAGAKKNGGGSLLFYWHGTGSFAGEVNTMVPAAVRNEILQNGGIIISPQGSLGTGGDCSGTGAFAQDDFKVMDLIAACAVRDHNIDPRRIYTTGCSAGGLQSGCMASLRASYIAAATPNSGGIVIRKQIQQAGAVPAIMTMHGGPNDMVIVTFSETSKTLDTQFKGSGAFVVNCDHGGGHCGAPAPLYTAAWEFMKAHPYGTQPSPYAGGLPGTFPNYCKIF